MVLVDSGEQLEAPHHVRRVAAQVFGQALVLLFGVGVVIIAGCYHIGNDFCQLFGLGRVRARPDLDVLAKGEVDLLEVDVLHELDRREGVIFAGHEVLVLQQSSVEAFSILHVSC